MRKMYVHSLFVIGFAMVLIGVWFIVNPSTSLRALIFTIGIVLVLSGISKMFFYFRERKLWDLSRWELVNGIFSCIVGIIVFLNIYAAEQIFVMIIAIWVLASSIIHIFMALAVKGFPGWSVLLVMGIITAFFAVISLFTNMVVAITVAFMMGISCITLGLTWISLWWVIYKMGMR